MWPKKLSRKKEAVRKRQQFATNPLKQPWVNLRSAANRRREKTPNLTFVEAFDDALASSQKVGRIKLTPNDISQLKLQARGYARLYDKGMETIATNNKTNTDFNNQAQLAVSVYELLLSFEHQHIMHCITEPHNLLQLLNFVNNEYEDIALRDFCGHMATFSRSDLKDIETLLLLIRAAASENVGLFRTFLVLKMLLKDRKGSSGGLTSKRLEKELIRTVEKVIGEVGCFIAENHELNDDTRRSLFNVWIKGKNDDINEIIKEYAACYWGDKWYEDLLDEAMG